MKKTSKILLTSLATIAMSASLVVGGTYALFTSEDSVNIAVTAGTVAVTASIEGEVKTGCTLSSANESFEATVNEAEDGVDLTNMLPGDYAEVTINIANKSSVAIQYRVIATVEDNGLADVLEITYSAASKWTPAAANEAIDSVIVKIALPENVTGDKYSGKGANISFTVEAVQSNGVVEATTAQGVVDALAAGRPVVLAENISIDTVTELSGDSYIDLNGHELTTSLTNTRPFKLMGENTTISIVDGNVDLGSGSYGLVEVLAGAEATVVMENVNVSGTTNNGALVRLRDGCSVDITLDNVNYTDPNGWVISTDSCKELNIVINGGTYKSYRGVVAQVTDATITGATFVTTSTGFEFSTGNAVLNNCNVSILKGNSWQETAIAASFGANVVVNDSYVSAFEDAYAYGLYASEEHPEGGNMTVNGGAYSGNLWMGDAIVFNNVGNMALVSEDTTAMDINNALQEGATAIALAQDITLDKAIEAKGDLTIVGNGNTLTTTDNRFVNVTGVENATVTLQGVVLASEVERGVSFYGNSGSLDVVIEDCDINVSHYGINVASANENANLVIKDSTIEGYCAFQTWSANTNVTFENCTLIGTNKWSGDYNNFATIVVNQGADNCVLTFNNCTIIANENTDLDTPAAEYHVINKANGTKINFNNCTFIKNGATVEGAITLNNANA